MESARNDDFASALDDCCFSNFSRANMIDIHRNSFYMTWQAIFCSETANSSIRKFVATVGPGARATTPRTFSHIFVLFFCQEPIILSSFSLRKCATLTTLHGKHGASVDSGRNRRRFAHHARNSFRMRQKRSFLDAKLQFSYSEAFPTKFC